MAGMAGVKGRVLKRWSGALRRGVAFLPIAAGATAASAQSLTPAGNVILPDGRTATNLAVNGSTTDVTTGTMAGGNAYNSFSRFEVGANNTVNLHVPDSAGHLINIVRDAPVVVSGTLNAMKEGRIGGNVVFADPYGFVVNKNGVVNAGSLTVNTPTRDFLDQTLDAHGRIDVAKGARIISGDVPLSPDGSIVIKGKINTQTGVSLKANSVAVTGPGRHKAQFEATVNTEGHRTGGQIVVRNGKLQIVAAGSAKIGGKLSAGGGSRGGDIQISSGGALKVLPTARIEALRANDAETLNAAFEAVNRDSAGKVSITSAGDLTVAGSVLAQGAVNVGGAVTLSGGNVSIKQRANIAATTAAVPGSPSAALAKASVDVRSTGDLTLAGKISADGALGRTGGQINVLAMRDIALASTAELSANGIGGSAGRIIVFADRNLKVADGFTVKAAAGATGDGGFAELSAKKVVEIATVNLDLGAGHGGNAGTLFIDPEDLVIGSGTDTATTSYIPTQLTNGVNYMAQASNSITIKNGFGIDTRALTNGVSSGNSGSVTLEAPNITVESGGYINAGVTTGSAFLAGDVWLRARQSSVNDNFGTAGRSDKFTSTITVNGTITGKEITLEALAEYKVNSLHAGTSATVNLNGTITGTTVNVLSKSISSSNYNDAGAAFGVLNGAITAINPLGLDAAWISSSAKAHLNVGSLANITGSTVKLESFAIGESVDASIGVSNNKHLSIATIVGMVETDAKTNIAGGAHITTSTSLGIGAVTDTRLDVRSSVISGLPFENALSMGASAVGAVAYGSADVDANATIQSNANISGGGSVTVLSRSDNAFSVNAKVYGTGQTAAGGALAISEINSNTVARLGASVDNSNWGGRNVAVQAISNVKANDTSANTTVGTGTVSDILAAASGVGSLIGGATPNVGGITNLIYQKFQGTPASAASNNVGVKGAAALSISHGSITADASIAADSTIVPAPVINTTGNISVISDVINKKIVSNASAGVNSTTKDPTSTSTSATIGASAAVAIYDVGHYSRAYVGDGADLTGSRVAVNAYTTIPVSIMLSNWSSANQVFLDAYRAVVDNPGLFTSGAKATAESNELSLAGSYNHFNVGVDTIAWIGSNARITSTIALSQWTVQKLDAIGVSTTDGGNPVRYSFDQSVDIGATTDVESLNVTGNWGITGNASQGAAGGGSAGMLKFDIATIAGVGDATRITSAGALAVEASTRNFLVAVSPSSGSGVSLAASGMLTYVNVNSRTQASISNTADATADSVAVTALENLGIYNAAGQMQTGSGATMGAAIAITDINADTAAYIGDNYGTIGSAAGPQRRAAANTRGTVTANELTVRALTKGDLVVVSIAASVSKPVDPAEAKKPPNGTPSQILEALASAQTPTVPQFNLSIAGSSSAIANELNTRATVSGVDIERRTAGMTTTSMRVEAINTSQVYSVAGAAAISLSGTNSTGTAGVAGAIAVGVSANKTIASLSDAEVTGIKNIVVQGLTGGSYTVSGVGLAGAGGNSDLLTIAGSVSVAVIAETIQGTISNATISGLTGGTLAVNAYRKTEVSIGAGSMGIGGKSGVGIALTYTRIKDNGSGKAAEASITNSHISNLKDVSVVAAAPSRIYSGAAAVSALTQNGLTGAIVVNDTGGTILAAIDGGDIDVTGIVNVMSGTSDADDLNTLLSAATRNVNTAANNYATIKYENSETGAQTAIGAGAAIVSVAGSVGISNGNGVGAGVISNYVHQHHIARISGTDIDTDGAVTVSATDATSILAIGVGIGVATGGFAGQAAVVDNRVNSTISAEIGGTGSRTTIDAASLTVTAQDATLIRGSATSATLGSSAAGSIGIAINSIALDVNASIANAEIDTSGSVKMLSSSNADILTIALGVAGSSGSALAGSAASSKIGTSVHALVSNGSDIDAGNNAIVEARNSGRISVIAGAAGVGLGGAGGGISVVVNQIGGDTEARISDSTVDADGNGADDTVRAGALVTALNPGDVQGMGFSTPNFTRQTTSVSGVAVLASSTQTVTGVAVTLGIAGAGPAAAILPVTTLAGGSTTAAIERSSVGTRLGTAADILVSASSHTYSGNLALAVAGSATNMAGAATSVATTMNRSTDARILDSTVGSASATARPRNVKVEAISSQSASDIAIGGAAGLIGGGAGSAIVTLFNADTEAVIEGGTMRATSATVSADSTNGYFAAAGAGAAGLFGGYAGSAVVGVSKNTTIARLGATGKTTTVDLNGDLTIAANSRNVFNSNAYGFAGGVVGTPVAAMALVTVVSNDTEALIRDAAITIASGALVNNRAAGINLSAFESVDIKPTTAGGALVAVGSGFGAAANAVVLTSKVVADSSGGNISAPGVFDISATTDKKIDAKTITAGGGLGGGVGAAVGVIITGGAAATDALAELNKGGQGTLTQVNSVSAAGGDFVLAGDEIANWRSRAASALGIASPTDAQVQAWARGLYVGLLQAGSFTNDGTYVANPQLSDTARASALADWAALRGDRATYVLADDQLSSYASRALNSTDRTAFENLVAANNSTGMTFTAKAGVLAQYANEARTALGLTATPSDAQIRTYLENRYQGFVAAIRVQANTDYNALLAKGVVTDGQLVVSANQLAGLASSQLSSTDATTFTTLDAAKATGTGFSLVNVDAQYANGKTFREAAADILGVNLAGTQGAQRAQTYWAGVYNGFAASIRTGADADYREMTMNQLASRSNFSVTNAISNASEGIYAGIGGGIVAVGSVAIDAVSAVSVTNMASGVGVGVLGNAGGAAVTYTESNAKVFAYAAGTVNANVIAVNALARDGSSGSAASSKAYAGAGGLMAAVGASVAMSKSNNNVTATLGGTLTARGANSGVLTTAMDTTTLNSEAVGATMGGGAAVGASIAEARKSSTVETTITTGSRITGWTEVSINAGTAGALTSKAIAGAGGIGAALVGAVARSVGEEAVTASIGNNAEVNALAVDVVATAMPKLTSEALGIAVSYGMALGASTAESLSNVRVNAFTGNDVIISGGGLNIAASALKPTSGDTASSRAIAGTGGSLIGANATVARSTNSSQVNAYTGDRLRMPNGDVSIAAVNDSRQRAVSTGIAAGFVAAGGAYSESTSSGSSKAWLGDGAVTQSSRLGALIVNASGMSENRADSTAGSGGVVAGAAAIARTKDTSSTLAELKSGTAGYTIYTGGLSLEARHDSIFHGNADSFQASAVGASGADAKNVIDSDVTATVGAGMIIHSLDNVFITATSMTGQDGGGARAGSGGVLAGAAALSDTTIYNDTTVNIGANSVISLNGDPTTADVKIDIEAFNQLEVNDTVRVDSGGYYAGGGGKSNLAATIRNAVNIGNNAYLFSIGGLQVGTASVNMSSNNANGSFYGVVTGAGASTSSSIDVQQDIGLGNNVTLEAFGNLTLTAGQSGNGFYATLVAANATTEVYNYAMIPITAYYRGYANARSVSNLTMGTGGKLLAGRNILVGAYKGSVSSEGRGTNHNPYLALFNTTTHDDNADKTTGANVVLNGTIYAGINNSQQITIGYNGSVTLASRPYPFAFTEVAAADVGKTFISYNDRKLRYDIAQSFNPYQDIVNKIMALTGLNEADTRWRLQTHNDIFYGVNVSADARRQVETFVNQIYTGVPDTAVASVAIGSIMASAGNVTINADTLSGTASVTAKGAPRIDIVNEGRGYVLLNKLLLTSNEGGHVDFTGAAAASSAPHITVSTDTGPAKPEISVRSTWGGDIDHLGNVTIPSVTPDIYFLGDVQNLNGAVTVRNAIGNVSILANSFEAATVDMQIPRGNFTVNQGAGSLYDTNNSVLSQWRNTQYRPMSASQAVMAVATYMERDWASYDREGNPTDNASFTARTLVRQYFNSISGGPDYSHGLISDVWFKVYPDNIGGQNSQTGSVGDFREGYFRWTVWNGDGDGSGPFGWLKFDVIQRQGLSYEVNRAVNPPASTPQIVGGSIIISAGTINVNGTIQSGFSNSWSVNIGSQAASTIAYYKNNASARAANAGRFIELSVSALGGTLDTTIKAYYDVSNDRIELQNVVQGAGGRVYLNGGIISTSTREDESQGIIRVNGGYATVNVVNSTGTALVTNTINTGVSTSSTVEIVDQYQWSNGAPIRTWYVYDVSNPNAPLTKYTQDNGSTNTNYLLANKRETIGGQTTTYNPHGDLLYQWVETATAVRAANANSHVQLGEWQWESNASDPYSTTRSVIIGTQNSNFKEVVTGTATYTTVDKAQDHENGTDFHGYWVQRVYDRATITLTNTVRASNPISIQFIGGSTGQVAINSNASVLVNGTITNYNGSTSITTTGANSAITASRDGSVSGQSVTLNGQGGIGSSDQALTVQVYGGTLTASSTNRDINISARGDVTVASVKVNGVSGGAPQGNVTLSATGDITSASAYNVSNPIIVGKSVSLNSSSGAIGARSSLVNGQPTLTNINPIVIQASGIVLGNGRIDGGVLDSTSSTGAYIVQSRGDLRVGHVTSNGAVFLAAAGSDGQAANILAGATRTGISAEESARLQQVWNSLDLMRENPQDGTVGVNGTPNTAAYAGSAAVHSYEAMINRSYEDYWQLRTMVFGDGVNYGVTPAGLAALKAQIAAGRNVPLADVSDAEVLTEAQRRFDAGVAALKAQIAADRGVATSAVSTADVEAEARRRFATARSILGLDQTVNANYATYWQLRDMAFADGVNYSITAQGSADLKAQIAATRQVSPSTITDAEVEAEARRRYTAIRAVLGVTSGGYAINLPQNQLESFRVVPTTSALTAALTTYTQGFSYHLDQTSDLFTSLTSGARWSLDQLTYTIDAAANPASNTPQPTIGQLPQNVAGRQVILYAPNGSIGSLAPPRTITFRSDNLAGLSEADRSAISAAGPGELQVSTRILAGGVTEYTVTLAQQDLLIASPLGTIAAKAKSEIYLGSASDLKLGGVEQGLFPTGSLAASYTQGVQTTNGGTVRLEAVGSVVGGVDGQVAISGSISNLTIISETGSIGRAGTGDYNPATNDKALLIALTGSNLGTLNLAQAAQGIYLRQTTGDLILGNISGGSGSQAAVQLGATGSIYAQAQFTDRTVPHILGSSLDLRAGGSISFRNGSTFQPLQVAITGAVTGYATGDFTLLSPTMGLTVGKSGTYGTIGAGGSLVLNSTGGAMTINRSVTAGSNLSLIASGLLSFADEADGVAIVATATNGDIAITAGTLDMGAGSRIASGGFIDILTTGNAIIGRIESTLAGTAAAPVIEITSGSTGSILANGDNVVNLATAAMRGISLSAGAGIDLTVSTAWLNATAGSGDISIGTAGALRSTTLSSFSGSVNVTSAGSLSLGTVTAGTDIKLISTGSSLAFTTVSASRKAKLEADGAINGTSVTTTTGPADLTAGGLIDIATLDIGTVLTSGAGTTTTFGMVEAGTSMWVTSGGLIDITSASTSTGSASLTSTGGAIALGSLTAGSSATLDADGKITATSLTSGTTADLTAGGLIDIATLDIGTVLTSGAGTTMTFGTVVAGTSLDVTSGGLVDITIATTDTGSASIASTNNAIRLGTLTAGSSATLDAQTDITAMSLTSGMTADVTAGGLIDIATLDIGTSLISNAGSTTTFGTVGAGSSMDITSRGLIDFTTATTDTGLASITSTGGAIQFGSLTAGSSAILDAHTNITATSLTSGTTADLTAGGLIDIATLDIGTSLISNAGSTTTFGTVDAGSSIRITSGGLIDVTTATTDTGSASLTSTGGSIQLGSLTAGSSATLDAYSDITATSLTSGTTADLTAGGLIDIATLDIGTALTSGAGATTTFGAVDAGTSMSVTSDGLIDITTATTDAGSVNLTSTGGAIQLGNLTAGSSATLDAHTDINATSLTSGTTANLTAGGLIDIATLDIGTALISDAGTTTTFGTVGAGISMSVTSGGLVDITTATTDTGAASLTSTGGAIQLGTLAAGSSATLDAGDKITATLLTSGTTTDLTAGGLIDIASLDIGTALTSGAGTTTAFGVVDAGTSMSVTSGGLIDITTATTDTGSANLISTGSAIELSSLTAGSSATLDAHTNINATSLTSGTTADLIAGGLIDIATLDVGTDLASRAGTTTTFGTADAGTSMSVTSGSLIDIATATTVTGAANLISTGGAIQLDRLTAGSAATLDAHTDIDATSLTSGTAADLTAGGLIDIATLDVGTVLASRAGTTTTFGTVDAGTSMSVTSGGLIDIATARTGTDSASLTSTGGAIQLGRLTAGSSATLHAHADINANSLTSGTTADLIAGGLIDIATLDIGTVLTSGAGATTTFDTVDAGTSMSVTSGGLIDITTATTDTGAANLTSTGGAIRLGSLIAGSSASLNAHGEIFSGDLSAGTSVNVTAGERIDIAQIVAGTSMDLIAGSAIASTDIRAGTSADLRAGTDISASSLTTGTFANLTAGGLIDIDTLDIGTTLTTHAGTTTTFQTVDAGTSMDITSGGLIDITTARARTGDVNLTSTSGAIAIDNLSAGGGVNLKTGTDISLLALNTGGSSSLTAAKDVRVTSWTSGGNAKADAGATVDIASLSAGGSIDTRSGDDTRLGTASAGGSVSADAGGTLDVANLSAGGSINTRSEGWSKLGAASAGGDFSANAGSTLDIVTLSAGRSIDTRSGNDTSLGRVSAGTDVSTDAGGVVDITTLLAGGSVSTRSGGDTKLGTASAGGNVLADAGGSLDIATLSAGGSINTRSGGLTKLGAVSTGVDFSANAGGTVDIGTLLAGRSIGTRSGSNTRLGTASSGAGFSVESIGPVEIGTGTAGGAMQIVSLAQSLTADTLLGAQDVTLTAATELRVRNLKAQGALSATAPIVRIGDGKGEEGVFIDAGSLIDMGQISSPGVLSLSVEAGGSIRLGRAEAVRLAIVGGEFFDVGTVIAGRSANIEADNIRIGNLVHNGATSPFVLDVTGMGGGDAKTLNASFDALKGVAIGDFRVADSVINTTGSFLSIARGRVTGTMSLHTALRDIYMNNQSAVPKVGPNVQLFQPATTFKLDQNGTRTLTDAFIVDFGTGSEVFFERNGVIYAGMSMIREAGQAMQAASGSSNGGGSGSPFGSDDDMSKLTAASLANFLALQTSSVRVVNVDGQPKPAVNLDR